MRIILEHYLLHSTGTRESKIPTFSSLMYENYFRTLFCRPLPQPPPGHAHLLRFRLRRPTGHAAEKAGAVHRRIPRSGKWDGLDGLNDGKFMRSLQSGARNDRFSARVTHNSPSGQFPLPRNEKRHSGTAASLTLQAHRQPAASEFIPFHRPEVTGNDVGSSLIL